jgi:eukaryotic-like serine/threonine-protein kinase
MGGERDNWSMTTSSATPIDDPSPAPPLAVGDMGRYVLKDCLSRTGSGSVYVAFDSRLSRGVVVKVLKTRRAGATDSAGAGCSTHAADLLAGARVAARLVHPGIVTVYDAGLCEREVYVAMERLEGHSLQSRLAGGWHPEPRDAVRIASRVAAALVFAHEAGALHGRVEPANVFLTGPHQLKMLNFGIASVDGRFDESVSPPTDEAAADGPLRYVAPERLLGEAADERCDVYGLGLVMYELLTGRPAFSGASSQDVRHAVLLSDVAAVHTLNPAVPIAVSTIVARAMARDPALRYPSARDMLLALRPTVADANEPARQGAWQDRRLQGAAALVGLLAVGTLGVMALRGNTHPTPRAAAVGVPTPATPSAPVTAAASEPVSAEQALVRSVGSSVADSAARPLATIQAAASASAKRAAPRAPSPAAAPKIAKAQPPAATARQAQLDVAPPLDDIPAPSSAAASAPMASTAPPAASAAAPTPGRGAILLAVEPWGKVEVNGTMVGTAPPMRRLTLPNGNYTITIRNDAFPPYSIGVTVSDDKPTNINHRFGS